MSPQERQEAANKIIGFMRPSMEETGIQLNESQISNLRDQIQLDLEVNNWTMEQVIASETGSSVMELMGNFPKTMQVVIRLIRSHGRN